jgi:hypothetical protein
MMVMVMIVVMVMMIVVMMVLMVVMMLVVMLMIVVMLVLMIMSVIMFVFVLMLVLVFGHFSLPHFYFFILRRRSSLSPLRFSSRHLRSTGILRHRDQNSTVSGALVKELKVAFAFLK